MIQSLKIRNFQSHKKTDLQFVDGVNVIIGSSDSGKSTIIRALRWVVWNKPSGNAFRSTWGGETSVKIEMDSHHITRIKDKAEEYILSDSTDSLSFKAFGKEGVPVEISNTLNLSEINLQAQHDSPFLISATPGEVATHFNKVARLDKIDQATANVNKWVRELTADIKYKDAEVKRLEEQKETFRYLQKMEIEIEVLEEMQNQVKSKGKKVNDLSVLFNSWLNVSMEKNEKAAILVLEMPLNNILSLYEQKRLRFEESERLRIFLIGFDQINEGLEEYGKLLEIETPLNNILGLIEKKKALFLRLQGLKQAVSTLNDISTNLKEMIENKRLLEIAFKKEMPLICPLCESYVQPIKNK